MRLVVVVGGRVLYTDPDDTATITSRHASPDEEPRVEDEINGVDRELVVNESA